jgi:hypothetical protein
MKNKIKIYGKYDFFILINFENIKTLKINLQNLVHSLLLRVVSSYVKFSGL